MTQEEKAKAYDEAFKEAEKIHKFSSDLAEIKRMEQIFPELIDTDKVIKCLINGMKFYYENNEDATWGTEKFSMKVKDIIKWLEKQGDKDKLIQELGKYKVKYTQEVLEKHINSISNKDDERLRKTTIAFLKDFAEQGYENAVECIDWLEKQGEDKEINNFDVLPGLYKCVHRIFDGTPDSKLLFEVGNVYKCLSKHDRAEFEISYGHSVYLEDPVVCKHFIPFEKQGEKKSVFEMKTPEESLSIDSDTYNKIVDECVYGEQKPIINGIPTATNYDKMFQNCNVHKFNVGDTIKITGINNGHIGCSILNTEDGYYYNWKLIKNKSAWNEENDDDAWMNDIISKVENNLQLNKAEIDWLKSLKERMIK